MATTSEVRATDAGKFRPSSSIAGDAWHGEAPTPAYEWWYFDALSDDRRDALVVIFLTNFIFSPRYNRAAAESLSGAQSDTTAARFPAVAVFFYRDGRPLFRAINEYPLADFRASPIRPECQIGHNSFRLLEDGATSLYELNIHTTLRRRKLLQAKLSWIVSEGDFFEEEKGATAATADDVAHHWNMVAPRCEVSGEVTLTESDGARSFEQRFHGTGYHDHNRDSRWMPATISEWQWGRIHFPATTAVFYRYRERDETKMATRLYLIQDNAPAVFTPLVKTARTRQHFFGPRYPSLLEFQTAPAVDVKTLRIRQQRVIDSSFFYLRFLSQATLEIDGREPEHATGITEHLAPRSLSYGWLRWLINMRIGRNNRGAFLP